MKDEPAKIGKKLLKVLVERSLQVPVLQERVTKLERRIALLEGNGLSRRTRIQVWRSRGGLGDIVMQSIIAKGLKQMWPECHITYAVPEEYMDIPRHNPFVDEVVAVNAPYYEDGYDYSVKLSDPCPAATYEAIHSPDIKRTRVDLFLSQAKVRLSDKHLVYEVTEEEKKWAKKFLKDCRGPRIGFALHAAEKWRDWPIENFHRLADMIDGSVLIFDKKVHDSWLERDGVYNVCGMELCKAAALVEQLDLIIGPDSGLLHLAGALDVPMIGLFGPTDPRMRIADYKNAHWMPVQRSCHPCWYSPCQQLTCLKEIRPEAVVVEAKQILRKDKIFVVGGGGLGDLVREYLGGQHYWGQLKAIKEKYPQVSIKAILCIHNFQATEFLKYNPYIDSIEQYPWEVDGWPVFNAHKGDYKWIKDMPDEIYNDNLPYERPEIYLSQEEKLLVQDIQGKGKYVFMHPFAGGKDRIALPIAEYPSLIDRLIVVGYNVVMVGGSYRRINKDGEEKFEEIFDYERDGFFNLVNKTNARVATKLALGAKGFIGTHSCFILPAWSEKIKSVLIVPEKMREYLHGDDANTWVVRDNLDFNKTIYANGDKPNWEGIKKEALEWVTMANNES